MVVFLAVIAKFKTRRIMHADYRRRPLATFPKPSQLWLPSTSFGQRTVRGMPKSVWSFERAGSWLYAGRLDLV
jgi:hypothetical protein